MNSYRAVEILDGFGEPCESREEYIEACRWIRDNGPRGLLCGNGTRDAIAIADAYDNGTLED